MTKDYKCGLKAENIDIAFIRGIVKSKKKADTLNIPYEFPVEEMKELRNDLICNITNHVRAVLKEYKVLKNEKNLGHAVLGDIQIPLGEETETFCLLAKPITQKFDKLNGMILGEYSINITPEEVIERLNIFLQDLKWNVVVQGSYGAATSVELSNIGGVIGVITELHRVCPKPFRDIREQIDKILLQEFSTDMCLIEERRPRTNQRIQEVYNRAIQKYGEVPETIINMIIRDRIGKRGANNILNKWY